jgi:hypothetical protein
MARPQSGPKKAKLIKRFEAIATNAEGESLEDSPSQSFIGWLQFLDHLSDFVLTLSELLLKPSKHFIFFTFREHQIIIGEISVLLFKLALQLVPRAFDFKFVHKKLDAWQVAIVHFRFGETAT